MFNLGYVLSVTLIKLCVLPPFVRLHGGILPGPQAGGEDRGRREENGVGGKRGWQGVKEGPVSCLNQLENTFHRQPVRPVHDTR